MSIWDKLFDPNLAGPIAFMHAKFDINTGDTLPKRSPDNPGRGIASIPMLEGVLVALVGSIKQCGFETVSPTNQDSYIIHWIHPSNPKELIYVRGNFKTRVMQTSHPEYALTSFGALSVGACIHHGVRTFKDAWSSFLTEAVRVRAAALTLDAVGELSDICYGAIRFGNSWPAKATKDQLADDWTIETVPAETLKKISFVNIRTSLATTDDFDVLMDVQEDTTNKGNRARFQGEQLEQVQRFLRRKKHLALLGPPGVGKSLCSFEALRLLGYEKKGEDYQLFTCHEEVKSSDLIGAWQPNGSGTFDWVDGPLVRAMTYDNGRGQPMLVEEFTRMPTKSQNIFISVLSDGYLVRNEKPDSNGVGELVLAGPDFVLLTDMNVDPAVDDIDLYGAAFARRVRKIEFSYPQPEMLQRILRSETGCSVGVAAAVSKVYSHAMNLYKAHDIAHPINPGSAVQWIDDYLACTGEDCVEERVAAQQTAKHTWLRDVCGVDEKLRNTILTEIEAAFRALGMARANKKTK